MPPPSCWQSGVASATLTTMKVGGLVDWFARPATFSELQETFTYIKEHKLKYKVLGGGSNLIFPDEGLRGVVVQPKFTQILPLDGWKEASVATVPSARYQAETGESYLYLETSVQSQSGQPVYVEMGASVAWGQAVAYTLQHNLAGLQWFARIPCQVGGAVYNNIHAQSHFLSEILVAIKTFDPTTGEMQTIPAAELSFDYDFSSFHLTKEVIVAAIFKLDQVSPDENIQNKALYLEWTKEKARVQPSGANCGSVFKNLVAETMNALGYSAVAAAWYIDQCGLKGAQEGGMLVYPGHANFIINTGTGSQKDFMNLVSRIRAEVFKRFGFMLEPEVECIDQFASTILWPKSI